MPRVGELRLRVSIVIVAYATYRLWRAIIHGHRHAGGSTDTRYSGRLYEVAGGDCAFAKDKGCALLLVKKLCSKKKDKPNNNTKNNNPRTLIGNGDVRMCTA